MDKKESLLKASADADIAIIKKELINLWELDRDRFFEKQASLFFAVMELCNFFDTIIDSNENIIAQLEILKKMTREK